MKKMQYILGLAGIIWLFSTIEMNAGVIQNDSIVWHLHDRILPPASMIVDSLHNGLNYIVLPNDSPSKMVEFRLIFKSGSVLEDDSNRGCAHFLEHIAFGGTRHFPGRKLIEYLESIGIQYGRGINAYTGHDRTIYMFSVPADKEEYIDNALLIVRDWLTGISVTRSKVEGEKGIILEEIRGYDIGDEFYGLKIGESAYSKGISLGTEESVKGMTVQKLKDFYKLWYTLDRATLVVAGDVDAEYMAGKIAGALSGLKASDNISSLEFPLEYRSGITVSSIADSLLAKDELEIIIPHQALMKRTLGDAVDAERSAMLIRGISSRLYEVGISATVSNHWYLADKEHFVMEVTGEGKDATSDNMVSVLAEILRIAEYGFTTDEMDELKSEVRMVPPYTGNSAYICDEISDAVLFDDWKVAEPAQINFVRQELDGTTSSDLQTILCSWLESGRISSLAASKYNPALSSAYLPKDIETIFSKASEVQLPDYVCKDEENGESYSATTVIPAFLLETGEYNPEDILSREYYEDSKITEVCLANGLRIVLRPTDDLDKKIYVQTFAPGGLSVVPEEDYAKYSGMAGYMELGGISGVDNETYSSLLYENNIGIVMAMENYWHGQVASAATEDSRLLLNILYYRMVSPSLDYEQFEEIRESELEDFSKESYLSRLFKTDVLRQMSYQIDSLMGNLVYGRRMEVTEQDLHELSLDTLAAAYRSMYSNPDGTVCVICGDFDTDSLLAEAVPVFSRMKKSQEPNVMGPSHFSLPETSYKKELHNPNESQTIFDYVKFGTFDPSLRATLKLKLMNALIMNRLLVVLREKESLAYSPYSFLSYAAYPDGVFYIDINASVDRNNTARVREVLDEIIGGLLKRKVSKKELDSINNIFMVNKRCSLQDDASSVWKTYLVNQLRNGATVREIDGYDDILVSITPEEIRDEFRKNFSDGKFVLVSSGKF